MYIFWTLFIFIFLDTFHGHDGSSYSLLGREFNQKFFRSRIEKKHEKIAELCALSIAEIFSIIITFAVQIFSLLQIF